jgi:uroporphyrinogen-III synthase
MALQNSGLGGLKVLSLESRRAEQMATLIRNYGGVPVVAPSMREVPIEENAAALSFGEKLLGGSFDAVIFLTGVGARILLNVVETRYPRERLVESLSRVLVAARGPKPVAVLREYGVPIGLTVPEPNTRRDLLESLKRLQPAISLHGMRIAVQEYGVSNAEFLHELRELGALVTPVPVYQWALPEDLGPLRSAVDEIVAGRIDVLLVTSASQFHNLMRVAADMGLAAELPKALRGAIVGSVGPIASEALLSYEVKPDFEPSPTKMGQLVFEAAGRARKLLEEKRSGAAHRQRRQS